MASQTYTLVLSKGVHIVSSEVADKIRKAIEARLPLIDVDIDLFGGIDQRRTAAICTQHVIAITANPEQLPSSHSNVASLRNRR